MSVGYRQFRFRSFSVLIGILLLIAANQSQAQQLGRGSGISSSRHPGGSGGYSVHGHGNSVQHSGNYSRHHSYRPSYAYNYRDYGYIPNRSSTYLNISRYGVGFGYYDRNVGISIGTSRYYQPGNRYYNSLPYGYYNYPLTRYYSYRPFLDSSNYGWPDYGDASPAFYPSAALTPSESLAARQLMGDVAAAPELPQTALPMPFIRTADVAVSDQRNAEASFRNGDYQQAAQLVGQALMLDNNNGQLYLFSSQANFAIGNYTAAFRDLEDATTLLPENQWAFVVKNFRSVYGKNDYVAQTERLSNHIERNPADGVAYTLRGYHFGSLGYPEAAASDLKQALVIDPANELASRLIAVFGSPDQPTPEPELNDAAPADANPSKGELPEPGGLEEIQGSEVLRLVPESKPVSPELTGPLK